MDYEEILKTLVTTALEDPETGWLSDLSCYGLEYDDSEMVILCGHEGSVDVGHLAEIVFYIIRNTQEA